MKVAVVGGGVMGAAAAWQLQRRGIDVVLHERFGPGHVRGSSHGGSRIFRFAYDDPEHVPPVDPSAPWPSFIHRQSSGMGVYGLATPGEGVKVAEHHVGAVVDPDTRDFALDPVARDRIVEYVERWLPGLDPTPQHETTCLYTNTPNEDFVLDRVGDVVIVSACSGHGFKFAPEIGRLAAALALGGPVEHERFTIAAHKR